MPLAVFYHPPGLYFSRLNVIKRYLGHGGDMTTRLNGVTQFTVKDNSNDSPRKHQAIRMLCG